MDDGFKEANKLINALINSKAQISSKAFLPTIADDETFDKYKTKMGKIDLDVNQVEAVIKSPYKY